MHTLAFTKKNYISHMHLISKRRRWQAGQIMLPLGIHARTDKQVINKRPALPIICYAFRALTLLVGQQEGHPARKKLSGGVPAWLSVWSEVQTCIWPS